MGMSEKETESSYSLLRSDRSTTSDDDLYDGHLSGIARPKVSSRSRVAYSIGGLAMFLVYSALLITFTSMWWKKDRLHGANVIDCKSKHATLHMYRRLTVCPQLRSDSTSSTSLRFST